MNGGVGLLHGLRACSIGAPADMGSLPTLSARKSFLCVCACLAKLLKMAFWQSANDADRL